MERKGLANEIMAVSLAVISVAASAFMIMDRTENGPRFLPDYDSFVPPELPESGTTTDAGVEDTTAAHAEAVEAAEDEFGPAPMTIIQVPRTEDDVRQAFSRAVPFTCRLVPEGNPLELSSFTPYILGETNPTGPLPPPCARRHVLSLGLDITSEDQRQLPTLSSGMIVSYLRENFISIQAKVGKDPVTGEPFLLPCPIATSGKFRGASVTGNMESAARDAARNFRGLGIVMKPGMEDTPENKRTLAMVQRYMLSERGDTMSSAEAKYELVFVRAIMDGGKFALHSFATTNERTILHHLGHTRKPIRTSGCDIHVNVFFTEYSHGGQVPEEAVVRNSTVKSLRSFPIEDLDAFAAAQQWEGTSFDNLSDVLDAIINDEVHR